MTSELNLKKEELKLCSKEPLTGYLRDGYCRSINGDYGVHTVCAKMNSEFLDYTSSQGNDLSSVVKPGQNWCLCQNRWEQAYQAGKSPEVMIDSSNFVTQEKIKKHILSQSKKKERRKKRIERRLLKKSQKNQPKYKKI